MVDVKNFKELNKSDVTIAGGKGASLGEMTQAGIPVPPGFVVLTTAFDQFIEETGLKAEIDAILYTVNHQEIHTGEFASEKIRALILNQGIPVATAQEITTHFEELGAEYVAVRSSASAEDGTDAAWAGQLESYLNTTEDDLLEKVKLCWSSLFTPRAIFYRFKQGFQDQHISVAVVVQKMVVSEISGIGFSVHPVTEDPNQLIIEAGFGLGEAIVSGSITPDNYVVEKDKWEILDSYISEQTQGLFRIDGGGNEWQEIGAKGTEQKLANEKVIELAKLIVKIENHYGFPVDTEWAYEAGQFYIVQSRPITTLQQTVPSKKWNTPALVEFAPEEYEFHGLWKCTILTDYFWSVIFNADLAKKADLPLTETGSFTLNVGNFLTKRSIKHLLHDRIMRALKEKDLEFFNNLKIIIDSEFKETKSVIDSVSEEPLSGEKIRRSFEALKRLAFLEATGYLLTYSFEPELLTWAKQHDINDQDIANYIPAIETPLLLRQQELSVLKEELQKDNALNLPDDQLLQKVKAISEISKKFDEHIEKFGWIEILGFGGEKLTPERLISILRDFEPTTHIHKELKELSEESEIFLKAASYLSYVREIGAEYFSMCSLALRPLLGEAATKLGITYADLIDLLPEEIASQVDNFDETKLREVLAKRATGLWALFEKDGQPCVIDDPDDINKLAKALLPQASDTDELHGQVGFPGIVKGKARIIMNSSEFGKMQKGEILVTTMTTPDFVTLMQMASAIVTDTGGLLSHAAIVSRELQKPCVIGTKFATQTFKDGDMIEVDANVGVVRKLESKTADFKKAYTRDTTLIIQQGWNACVTEPFDGAGTNPFIPPVIHLMNDGVIEIWENEKATQWVLDSIQELIKTDERKFLGLVDQYEQDLAEIKEYWEKGAITNTEEFEKYVNRVFEVMKGFDCMYFPSTDDLTPAHIRERLLKLRDTDTYFDSNDKLMRASLVAMYPNLKGYESTILKNEIKNPPALEVLKERKKSFVIIGEEYAEQIALGDYMVKHPDHHFEIESPSENSAVLTGQIGNKGYARGIVRIMKRKEQISEAQEGDIIVSPMTTPDFLPAMQKAAAFITDEGGVTCHAAIVARELNKPCIIGTKFATQVLHDGDEVEVDANAGMVRKIGAKKSEDLIETSFGDWSLGITRNMSFWHQWLSSLGHYHNSKDFGIGFPNRQLAVTTESTQTSLFFTSENNTRYAKAVLEAVSTKEKIDSLKVRYQLFANELEESLAKLNKDLSLINWDNFVLKYQKFCAGLFLTSTIGRAGVTKLTELLKNKHFPEEEIPEIIASVSYPEEHTPLFQSQLDLIKIGEQIQDNPSVNKEALLERWLKNHGFIPVNFCENPWTLEDANSQLGEMLARDCSAELNRLVQGHHGKINEKTKWLNKIDDPEITVLAHGLAEATYLNEFRKNVFSRVSLGYRSSFTEVARLAGSEQWKDCFYLTPDEMRDIIAGKKPEISTIVQQRKAVGYYIDEKDGTNKFLQKNDLDKFINFIESAYGQKNEGQSEQKIIKGLTVNKGLVRGTARLILSAKDFHKIGRGDILVTTMTSVDFVPIMEKAGAFVTNEGGITSHASIVAREMNKPCVIGTQIATKIIKDGDEVEVDANNGIVRIIDGK